MPTIIFQFLDSTPLKRSKRSEETGEKTIETLLALDRSMAQFYGVDAAKEYALTVANVVSYHMVYSGISDPCYLNLKSVSKKYAVFLASVCEPGSREFI